MAAVPRTSHFCGNLPTNQTFTADDINSKWTFVRNVSNQCYANYLYLWPHIVAPVAMLLALLYMKTWGRVDRSPNYGKLFQLTFPLQSLRCVIMLSLALVQMGNFGEGIVTDMEFQSLLPTQPQLYVPVLMAMLSTLMSMYFYQKLEVWNKPSGLGLLLLYWIWSAFAETIRFISLRKNDDFSFDVMRVCLCCTLATIYIILIVIECYVYIFQVRTLPVQSLTLPPPPHTPLPHTSHKIVASLSFHSDLLFFFQIIKNVERALDVINCNIQ